LPRAAGTLLECRRKERPPGVFHLHERGAGWSRVLQTHILKNGHCCKHATCNAKYEVSFAFDC
jgi:hypothetical protein